MTSYQPIENYGVIGDLHTVALVGMDGSIDFMCFPYFDSPTIFGRLLDHEKGGYFCLSPVREGANHKQLYLPDTNVLLSRFLYKEGVAEISDFMPVETVQEPVQNLVRRVKSIRGELKFRMICKPAFDYARAHHRVEVREDGEVIFSSEGQDGTVMRLRSEVPVDIHDGAAVAEFTLHSGETASFVLEEVRPEEGSPSAAPHFVSDMFKETVDYWHEWSAKSQYQGRWRSDIARSALILKMLTSWKYGSIVAAPTFGLPEDIGGERNWDYRYTWIRDSSFTLYALMRLGYVEEAGDFMKWIEDRCRELGEHNGDALQTMYRLDGGRELPEYTLPHLEGYRGSSPVRVGNGAVDQLQLDIYGELMDAVYLYDKYGHAVSYDLWTSLVPLLEWVCENWKRKDEGIWEVRGGQQEFLYSRLMCWVALDRGMRLARKRSLPAPLDHWRKIRDDMYREIFADFWDKKKKAFVQHKGADTLDASSLLMPLVKFISPTDPRWLSHLEAIEEELIYDSLVHRYITDKAAPDGLSGGEGTFNMCTFWYVECLSRAGQVGKARFFFEKMLGYANHLGLFAEETGPQGEHLGNYPQAFTHLSLISAAYDINRRLSERQLP